MPHEMWIADITDQCILGICFLQAHGCRVDMQEGALFVGEVPLNTPSGATLTLVDVLNVSKGPQRIQGGTVIIQWLVTRLVTS